MEALQDKFQAVVDGFIGQKLAEQITTYTLAVSALLGFICGFATQDIRYTVYIGLAGTGLTFLAVVPPWPVYNRDPVKFLAATSGSKSGGGGGGGAPTTITVGGEEVTVKT
ncbi:hypothetical protein DRE_02368 [Drechslerella stenobrocha 248]|uniref:Signal peptidase complex subunit 1 n=1 Tax=Drechslerella stenobrocha 248 TaxID=1043628 RepID=W7HXL6_9PEZI|nr:hypothetical protein DRE_02368 [Drechslerella stenobrocha 248]